MKTYEIQNSESRTFKCDGEFTVEVIDGKAVVHSHTPCFIDFGMRGEDVQKLLYKLISEELSKFEGLISTPQTLYGIKGCINNLLMNLHVQGKLKCKSLPVVDIQGELLLKKLRSDLRETNNPIDYVLIIEKIERIEAENANPSYPKFYLLNAAHNEITDWTEYARGF